MFFIKGVFKNITKFTGKHLDQALFSNKVERDPGKDPLIFAKYLRTPFLQNTSGLLLLSVQGL